MDIYIVLIVEEDMSQVIDVIGNINKNLIIKGNKMIKIKNQ